MVNVVISSLVDNQLTGRIQLKNKSIYYKAETKKVVRIDVEEETFIDINPSSFKLFNHFHSTSPIEHEDFEMLKEEVRNQLIQETYKC